MARIEICGGKKIAFSFLFLILIFCLRSFLRFLLRNDCNESFRKRFVTFYAMNMGRSRYKWEKKEEKIKINRKLSSF